MTVRLPDFVVLGMGKAGTSLIYRVLAQNPDIGLSEPKELHYFNANLKKGVDWYAGHFGHILPDAKIVGEVSPSYLRVDTVQAIADMLGPKTKVIFVLRRPIERAYSRYLQDICATQKGQSFRGKGARLLASQLQMIDAIQTCYDAFGPERVLPLFYETDIDVPSPTFESKILNFIGLEQANYYPTLKAGGIVNPGVMPRYMHTGNTALNIRGGASIYRIPPNHLVFCGQRRNGAIYPDPTPEHVRDAFILQSRWSPSVPMEEYRMLQRNAVLPVADRLEQSFGFDMSHWRVKPHQIMYDPALPPWSLRK